MYFTIQVNLARKNAPGLWYYLLDEVGRACIFPTEQAAKDVIVSENRGVDVRVIRHAEDEFQRIKAEPIPD